MQRRGLPLSADTGPCARGLPLDPAHIPSPRTRGHPVTALPESAFSGARTLAKRGPITTPEHSRISAGSDGVDVRRGQWILDTTRPVTPYFNPYEMQITKKVEWDKDK